MTTTLTQPQDIGGPAQPLLIVKNLLKHFPLKTPFFSRTTAAVQAVDDISFDVMKNETLGIVGESGCGKSTTARLLMQLLQQDRGELIFDGQTVGSAQLPMKSYRRQVQMVFQDSYSSLNPRMTILDTIAFAPIVHGMPLGKRSVRRYSCWRMWAWTRNALPDDIRMNCPAGNASGSISRGQLPSSHA